LQGDVHSPAPPLVRVIFRRGDVGGYVSHYNRQRPHRGIDLGVPMPGNPVASIPPSLNVGRHDVLGGLIHEYYPVAA